MAARPLSILNDSLTVFRAWGNLLPFVLFLGFLAQRSKPVFLLPHAWPTTSLYISPHFPETVGILLSPGTTAPKAPALIKRMGCGGQGGRGPQVDHQVQTLPTDPYLVQKTEMLSDACSILETSHSQWVSSGILQLHLHKKEKWFCK